MSRVSFRLLSAHVALERVFERKIGTVLPARNVVCLAILCFLFAHRAVCLQ
jgi:hypothetical protein